MSRKIVNSAGIAAHELPQFPELDGNAVQVRRGTVLARSTVFQELPHSQQLETESDDSWLIVNNAAADEVKEGLLTSGSLLSAAGHIEASAFGCDSNVLDRAIGRAVQRAADAGFDYLEILDVARHQNSGLDYVSICARGREVRSVPTLESADVRSSSSELQE